MVKKLPVSEEDKNLFRQATHGVKRLTTHKITHSYRPTIKKQAILPKTNVEEFFFRDDATQEMVGSETLLQFIRPGIQHKVLRKMRRGQYNVDAVLDLHGKTINESQTLLGDFLNHSKQQGLRHVLIIHGKKRSDGKPILKNKLNQWLRQIDFILAFCSAAPKDGHSGALYLLLRRSVP